MKTDRARLPRGKGRRRRQILWLAATLLTMVALGAALWTWRFRTYTPLAVALDIRAAVQARNAPRPAERFLELRYGPLTEPANRQKAFLDFFNIDHMEGLYGIVGHMQAAQKQTNIAATAQWIADYRRTLSPEEKASLRNYLNSGGRLNTPLIADTGAFHVAEGAYLGKNVLFFDGRVDKGKVR